MKFYHIIDAKRGSGITLAAEPVWGGEDYIVKCGASYCAPCEANFSRSRGRTIAISRLSSSKNMEQFKRFSFRTVDQSGLKTQILERLVEILPLNWAFGLASGELSRIREIRDAKLSAEAMEPSISSIDPLTSF
jgi:hypothetical protein